MHRLDARVKLLLSTVSVILIAAIPNPGIVFIAAWILFIGAGCLIGRIPLLYLLTRSAVVLPFSGFAAFSYALTSPAAEVLRQWGPFVLTSDGLLRALVLLVRAWIAVSLMILLVNSTPFDRLLESLRLLRVPTLFVLLLSFFYRYLYLLWDEAERLQRARNVRYFGGYWSRQLPLLGQLVTSLFLRSYERAQRVQMAMLARGWNGEMRVIVSRSLTAKEVLLLITGGIVLIGLWAIRTL